MPTSLTISRLDQRLFSVTTDCPCPDGCCQGEMVRWMISLEPLKPGLVLRSNEPKEFDVTVYIKPETMPQVESIAIGESRTFPLLDL